MRKKALQPTGGKTPPPESYITWRTCRDLDSLWWDGGVSAQPYYQLLEFQVCASVHNQWQSAQK